MNHRINKYIELKKEKKKKRIRIWYRDFKSFLLSKKFKTVLRKIEDLNTVRC